MSNYGFDRRVNKPPRGAIVDAMHPLSSGLLAAYLLTGELWPIDYSPFKRHITQNKSAATLVQSVGPHGAALEGVGEAATTRLSALSVLGLPILTAEYSLAVWFRFSASPVATSHIISLDDGNDGGSQTGQLALVWRNASGGFGACKNTGASLCTIANASMPSPTAWHHLAFTKDAFSNNTLFFDGAQIATSTTASDAVTPTSIHLMNYGLSSANESLNGQLESAFMWGRRLSAAEVAELYINPYNLFVHRTGRERPGLFAAVPVTAGFPFGQTGSVFNGGRTFEGGLR